MWINSAANKVGRYCEHANNASMLYCGFFFLRVTTNVTRLGVIVVAVFCMVLTRLEVTGIVNKLTFVI